MDDRLFQHSLHGANALVHYVLGDLNGAARAYRAHFRSAYERGLTSGDLPMDLLLADATNQAKEVALATLTTDSEDLSAQLTLGEAAFEEGHFAEAQNCADHVLKLKTDDADALVLTSLVSARTRKDDAAIHALNQALRHGRIASRSSLFFKLLEVTGDLEDLSNDDRPMALLANYYRYLRIHDESNGRVAIRYAKRAIQRGDRPADAYLAMGIVHEKQGTPDEALEALQKAIEQNPRHAEALDWGYRVYLRRGDLLKAFGMAKAAVDAAPGDPFYVQHLNTVLVNRLGNFQDAEPLLERAAQLSPDDAHVLWSLGYVHGMLGKYQDAVDSFERAIRSAPRKAELYGELGHWLGRLGRKDEAVAAYQHAISLNPASYQSHTSLAVYYKKQFRMPEALREYETAFRLGERNFEHRVDMCIAYHMVGEFQQSVTCLKAAHAQDPRNPRIPHLLPQIQHNLDLQRAG
jgi:tetratricopeptide (TPR) repeat protein